MFTAAAVSFRLNCCSLSVNLWCEVFFHCAGRCFLCR